MFTPVFRPAGEQGFVEVQAGGGAATEPGLRANGLVAGFVGVAGGALDVGRQGQAPVALEERDEVVALGKAQVEELAGAAEHLDVEGVLEAQPGAGLGRLAGADLGQRLVGAEGRSIITSTWPPVSLVPNRRAWITRVSLKTSRSPGARRLGRSENADRQGVGETCSSRLSVRRASGAWAISSCGAGSRNRRGSRP